MYCSRIFYVEHSSTHDHHCFFSNILSMLSIWGSPSGWFEILKCAPFKVSGSIPPLVPISLGKSIHSFALAAGGGIGSLG